MSTTLSRDMFLGTVTSLLTGFFASDTHQIGHALLVLHHALRLSAARGDCDFEIVVAAALLHDIGVKPSVEKLGYQNAATQEEFGPPAAATLLRSIDFDPDKTRVVCEIVGNHHSASRFDYPELVVIKEADHIINSGRG